jgi:hypothetical protein
MAVGFDHGANLAEQWNGSMWSIDTVPYIDTGLGLTSVSCTSVDFCVAVGSDTTIDMWNGTVWTSTTGPTPGTDSNELLGVSCVSSTWCMAVGLLQNSSDTQIELSLVEQWNGTSWSVVPSANPVPSGANVLQGVTCPSTSFCMAVGNTSGTADATLAEEWNGTTWAATTTLDQGAFDDLDGVSCASTTQCFAVGYGRPASTQATLIEEWDGTSWSITASPDGAGTTYDGLSNVSCPQPDECIAVGSNSTTGQFILSWDGSSWTVVPPPPDAVPGSSVGGVTCVSTTDQCVAVGGYGDSNDVLATLVESNYQSPVIATGVTVASSANPSVIGRSVTFTAAVNPSDGGGTVTFYADQLNTPISGCALLPLSDEGGSYQAQCATSALAPGVHKIVAAYTGDGNYSSSSGSLTGGQNVQYGSSLDVTSSANPSSYGQAVLFTATFPSSDGHGTVAFYADGSSTPLPGCGAVELEQPVSPWVAQCEDADLSGGTHSINALYSGDTAFAPAGGTLVGGQTVTPDPTSMTASPALLSLSPPGVDLFTLKATLQSSGEVLSGEPVVFTAGSTTLCTATTNSGGVASCNILVDVPGLLATLLSGGYTASFPGVADYQASHAKAPLIG